MKFLTVEPNAFALIQEAAIANPIQAMIIAAGLFALFCRAV